MNPGPIEEAGETARSAVDALRGTPGMLTLILLQIVMIGVLAWVAHQRNEYEASVNNIFSNQILELIKHCGPVQRGDIPLPIPFPADVPRHDG